jgi:outer membrane murein-binding lipoprotein Lpp
MSEKLDELASNVDDALTSVDELKDDPGIAKEKTIHNVKDALKDAKEGIDKMEDAEE